MYLHRLDLDSWIYKSTQHQLLAPLLGKEGDKNSTNTVLPSSDRTTEKTRVSLLRKRNPLYCRIRLSGNNPLASRNPAQVPPSPLDDRWPTSRDLQFHSEPRNMIFTSTVVYCADVSTISLHRAPYSPYHSSPPLGSLFVCHVTMVCLSGTIRP